jgi:DNA repair protein RadC
MENVNKPSTSIKTWSADDQPREKLMLLGPAALSNAELIAILIRTGNRQKSAIDLGREILKLSQDNLQELGKASLKELQQVKGIGATKAVTVIAALELGKRRQSSALLPKTIVRSSQDIAEYLRIVLKDYPFEVFAVFFLNRSNKINHFEIISKGGITGTVADPRLILKKALEEEATSLVLSHNHPSGSIKPSRADEEITQKIKQAAALLDIKVLDHIIVSEEGFFSFADEGMM